MRVLVGIIVSFLIVNLNAAEVTVGKVSKSGKKAVIYIPEGMTVEKGQTLLVGGGEESKTAVSSTTLQTGLTSRNYSVGAFLSFYSDKTEITSAGSTVEDDKSTFTLGGSMIKNMGSYEFGGGFNYTTDSTETIKNNGYGVNALFEYNFMPNAPGTKWLAHVGAEVGFKSNAMETNTGSEVETSGLIYGAYSGVKYFMLPSSSFAILADAIYLIDNSKNQDKIDVSTSRIGLRVGCRYYF